MWFMALTAVAALTAQAPTAQAPAAPDAAVAEAQRLFEAGQYDQVVMAGAADAADPAVVYLGGLSLVELDRAAEAVSQFERLAARPEDDVWRHIGASAGSLYQPGAADTPELFAQATAAAQAAVAMPDAPPQASFQLGLAESRREAFAEAAAAFEATIAAEPRFAYAHYYAGMAYYQVRRLDRMADAFQLFLTLAPDAPERARILSIMQSLRGR